MAEALQKILKHMAVFQDLSEHHIARTKPAGDQKDAIIEQVCQLLVSQENHELITFILDEWRD